MSVRMRDLLIVSALLFSSLHAAGCISTTIGDAVYSGSNLILSFTDNGGPSQGYVQVTIYRIQNNRQEEMETRYASLNLQPGENTAYVNGTLEPGRYKLYIYLIQDGERKAAAIRDITVS